MNPEDLAKEFILGVGFLEGLWIYAGVNPMTEIANAFSKIAPEGMFSGIFPFILFIIAAIQIIAVYAFGGVIGLFALLLAFLGGTFISNGILGIILVVIAFFLGLWAFSMKEKITFQNIIELFK